MVCTDPTSPSAVSPMRGFRVDAPDVCEGSVRAAPIGHDAMLEDIFCKASAHRKRSSRWFGLSASRPCHYTNVPRSSRTGNPSPSTRPPAAVSASLCSATSWQNISFWLCWLDITALRGSNGRFRATSTGRVVQLRTLSEWID